MISQHLFRLRQEPLSGLLLTDVRFLSYPLSSAPSLLLAEFLPIGSAWDLPSSASQIILNALEAIYEPRTVCPFPVTWAKPLQPDSVPFWFKRIGLFSLVCIYDSYNGSTFVSS